MNLSFLEWVNAGKKIKRKRKIYKNDCLEMTLKVKLRERERERKKWRWSVQRGREKERE